MSSQGPSGEQRQKIAVFNSTGRHAGAVICALREQNKFDVRALVPVGTKDPKVQELKDLGMEVLEVDLASRESIRKALKGTFGAFFAQNSFKMSHSVEMRNAKNVAFISRETDVNLKLLVHLTYPISEVAGEQELCDTKREISDYFKTSKTKFSEVELGWYMEHWLEKDMAPSVENGEYTFRSFVDPNVEMAWVSMYDLGPIVAKMFEQPETWLYKRTQIAGDICSMNGFVEKFCKVTGNRAKYEQLASRSNLTAREELLMSFSLVFARNKPYADMQRLKELHPGLKNINSWVESRQEWSRQQS